MSHLARVTLPTAGSAISIFSALLVEEENRVTVFIHTMVKTETGVPGQNIVLLGATERLDILNWDNA